MSSPSHLGLPSSPAQGLTSPNSSSLPQSRPIIDPLAFEDVRGLGGSRQNGPPIDGSVDGEEDGAADTGRTRGPKRNTGIDVQNIPRVKDATGETVMKSFIAFLEKSVSHQDKRLRFPVSFSPHELSHYLPRSDRLTERMTI